MSDTISAYVAAAIAGNLWQESGINPGIWQSLSPGAWTDLRKGFGLCQWTNTGGNTQGRLFQLHKYLSENGYPDDSFEGQVKFIGVENYWTGPGTLQDFLHSDSTDINYLTEQWFLYWESPGDSTLPIRQSYAARCFAEMGTSGKPDTEIFSGNRYLSEAECLSNSRWLNYYLSGGIGGGGGTGGGTGGGGGTGKVPIWLLYKFRRW